MEASDWIAAGSAAIAGVAACIAIWQAQMAKRSAVAADKQAQAAERQVAIMERQLAGETEDRDQAAGPQFGVISAVITDDSYGQRVARITVEQKAGAALATVTVNTRTSYNVRSLVSSDNVWGAIEWTDCAPGSTHEIIAALEYNYIKPVNVVLDFGCTEAHGSRTWRRVITAVPQPEPPPSRTRVRWLD